MIGNKGFYRISLDRLLKITGLTCLLLVTWYCDKALPVVDLQDLDASVERAEDIQIIYSDSAQLKVTVDAPTMLTHVTNNDVNQEFIDGVLVKFYDAYGNTSSRLTAKWGMRYDRQKKVIVRDSVVWRSFRGEMIESNELIWEETEQKVYTKKFARITRPDEIIYGYGFEADQDFRNARINAVTGRIKVEDIQSQ